MAVQRALTYLHIVLEHLNILLAPPGGVGDCIFPETDKIWCPYGWVLYPMFKCSNVQMFKCSNVQMFKIINDEEVSLQCLESLNIFYFH